MMMRSRSRPRAVGLLVALCSPFALLLASLLFATDAPASVSVAATWDALLHDSSAAVVVTAVEGRPVWENGRIITYTRVHVDRPVAGDMGTGVDAWVRTMGGVVGKVGQIVEGEAAFAPGESSLLFLRAGPPGSYVVTSRGQGQFPVVADDPKAPAHVVQNHAVGMLVPPRAIPTTASPVRLAADVMQGRPVDDVAHDIAAAWGAAHAR
jgi:hypothetical protein